MALFSEKYGYTSSKSILQIEGANDDLRMSIYNALYECIGEYGSNTVFEQICRDIWTEYWHQPIDRFPDGYWKFFPQLKSRIMQGEWYEGYNIIDFLLGKVRFFADEIKNFDPYDYSVWTRKPAESRSLYLNNILEREGSGYRIIDGFIAPITNAIEPDSIEQVLDERRQIPGASHHINNSLALLSKKPNPDFLNSVKESISAAEAAAKTFVPGKAKSLADAVTALEKNQGLHKSIAEAWKKMFGYTSDASGIRHAGSGEPVELDYAFAKYMLVTCSAFVNYLTEEFGEDG